MVGKGWTIGVRSIFPQIALWSVHRVKSDRTDEDKIE